MLDIILIGVLISLGTAVLLGMLMATLLWLIERPDSLDDWGE